MLLSGLWCEYTHHIFRATYLNKLKEYHACTSWLKNIVYHFFELNNIIYRPLEEIGKDLEVKNCYLMQNPIVYMKRDN